MFKLFAVLFSIFLLTGCSQVNERCADDQGRELPDYFCADCEESFESETIIPIDCISTDEQGYIIHDEILFNGTLGAIHREPDISKGIYLYDEIEVKDGFLHGSFCSFCETGQKCNEIIMENGGLTGNTTSWYPSGEIQSIYKENKEGGIDVKIYHQNGQLSGEGNAVLSEDGSGSTLHGEIKIWKEDGTVGKSVFFEKGEPVFPGDEE